MTIIATASSSNSATSTPVVTKVDPSLATTVAVMYNYYDDALATTNAGGIVTGSSNIIQLNPYGADDAENFEVHTIDASGMMLESFLGLFYPTNSGYFSVNQSNHANPAILLNTQTYTSSNSNKNTFSLSQQLLRAYCTQKNISVNSLDPRLMVLLQKECFQLQSLSGIYGTTISMSWDEVINSFLSSGIILHGDEEDSVLVPLSVVLNVHSFVLDIDLAVKFTYYVRVDGYIASTTPAAAGNPVSV